MAFIPKTGKIQVEYFPKTASTAISMGAVLETGSGTMNPADAADVSLFGVSLRKVASTDADYASTTSIPTIILNDDIVFEADVETGSATAALIGTKCDLASSTGVDVTATSHNVVTIVEVLSATKVLVRFNASYIYRNAA